MSPLSVVLRKRASHEPGVVAMWPGVDHYATLEHKLDWSVTIINPATVTQVLEVGQAKEALAQGRRQGRRALLHQVGPLRVAGRASRNAQGWNGVDDPLHPGSMSANRRIEIALSRTPKPCAASGCTPKPEPLFVLGIGSRRIDTLKCVRREVLDQSQGNQNILLPRRWRRDLRRQLANDRPQRTRVESSCLNRWYKAHRVLENAPSLVRLPPATMEIEGDSTPQIPLGLTLSRPIADLVGPGLTPEWNREAEFNLRRLGVGADDKTHPTVLEQCSLDILPREGRVEPLGEWSVVRLNNVDQREGLVLKLSFKPDAQLHGTINQMGFVRTMPNESRPGHETLPGWKECIPVEGQLEGAISANAKA